MTHIELRARSPRTDTRWKRALLVRYFCSWALGLPPCGITRGMK